MHRVFIGCTFMLWHLAMASTPDATPSGIAQLKNSLSERLNQALTDVALNMHLEEFETELHISYVDPRINLTTCDSPPAFKVPQPLELGRAHIKVSCSSPAPWAVNIPVELKLFTQVVVLKRPISRGRVISSDDIETRMLDISVLNNGYFLKSEFVIGKQSKRALPAQSVMIPHYLIPALMIKKGDSVMITAQKGGMTVKMSGEALNDGREGRQIRVKNVRSQRVVKARVIAPGIVQVDF